MHQGTRAIVVTARLDVDVAVDRANQGRGGGLDIEFGLATLAAAAEEYAPAAGTHQAGFVFAVFFDAAIAVFAGFKVDVAFVSMQHGAVVADDVHAGGVDVALSRRHDDGIAGDGAGFVLVDFGFDVVARVGAFEDAFGGDSVAVVVATGKAGKQNRQQYHCRPKAACALCRFCGGSHGFSG